MDREIGEVPPTVGDDDDVARQFHRLEHVVRDEQDGLLRLLPDRLELLPECSPPKVCVPSSTACVRCGGIEPDVTLVAFDLGEGGVLCRACRSGTAITPAAIALLRAVLGGRLNDVLTAPESPATHEVGVLATRALEHHIERRLRVVAMFERH